MRPRPRTNKPENESLQFASLLSNSSQLQIQTRSNLSCLIPCDFNYADAAGLTVPATPTILTKSLFKPQRHKELDERHDTTPLILSKICALCAFVVFLP